jgi:hypothetical protein
MIVILRWKQPYLFIISIWNTAEYWLLQPVDENISTFSYYILVTAIVCVYLVAIEESIDNVGEQSENLEE